MVHRSQDRSETLHDAQPQICPSLHTSEQVYTVHLIALEFSNRVEQHRDEYRNSEDREEGYAAENWLVVFQIEGTAHRVGNLPEKSRLYADEYLIRPDDGS